MGVTILHLLGYTSLGISLLGLSVVIYHWRFFNRSEKSELGSRMALVFLSDIFVYLSIAAYGFNWVAFDGGPELRVALKAFQVFAVGFNLYALSALINYYKKVR